MKTVNIEIKGMTCDGCKNSVERVLNRQDAVKKAIVNLEQGSAMVAFDEKMLSTDDMIQMINRLGFEAKL